MEKIQNLNVNKINLLFHETKDNNFRSGYLDEILSLLRIDLSQRNQKHVLDKLVQVLAYFNVMFLKDLIAQSDKIATLGANIWFFRKPETSTKIKLKRSWLKSVNRFVRRKGFY